MNIKITSLFEFSNNHFKKQRIEPKNKEFKSKTYQTSIINNNIKTEHSKASIEPPKCEYKK